MRWPWANRKIKATKLTAETLEDQLQRIEAMRDDPRWVKFEPGDKIFIDSEGVVRKVKE